MKKPLFTDSHPFTKFLFLLFIIVVSFSILLIIGLITAIPLFGISLSSFQEAVNVNNPENIGLIKYMQFIQHIGIFIVPPLVAAFVFSENPKSYLRADTKSSFVLYFLAGLIIVFAIPLINYTGAINAKLSLPESLSGLEAKIKAMEEAAKKMTDIFLDVKTPGGLAVNIILIALLPAIGEEFLFRGVLLKIFKEWTRNEHAAVLISAFLFSAVHFQFYGFLPRFLLGVLFGYLFVLSKNIWIPVTMHFINNGLAVVLYYFMHDTDLYAEAEKIGTDSSSVMSMFFSVTVLAVLIYTFHTISVKEKAKENQ